MLTLEPAQEGKVFGLELLRSIEQVRQVEVGNIVANDDVRIALLDKLTPALEHLGLVLELEHLGADDVRAGVEGEDVADEGLQLALPGHHVGDLDDGVDLGFGEDPFAAGALEIEAEDAQGGNLAPVAFCRMGEDGVDAAWGRSGHVGGNEAHLQSISNWHVEIFSRSDRIL
jgi:hypothetical protein